MAGRQPLRGHVEGLEAARYRRNVLARWHELARGMERGRASERGGTSAAPLGLLLQAEHRGDAPACAGVHAVLSQVQAKARSLPIDSLFVIIVGVCKIALLCFFFFFFPKQQLVSSDQRSRIVFA